MGGLLQGGLETDYLTAAQADAAYVAISTRVAQDEMRATRDIAYRTWNTQLASAATPRLLIEGHSVVVGSGASVSSKGFSRLVRAGVTRVSQAVSTTIDGHAGQTTTQILANGAPSILNASTPVGLVVLMCLLNDYSNGVASATSQSNLQAIIAAYRAANGSPSPSFLICAEWTRNDAISPTEPWANYVAAAKAVADANSGVAFLDLGARMGDPATDTEGLFYTDQVHPSDAGHALIARHVLAEIMTSEKSRGFSPHYIIPTALVPSLANVGWATRTGVAGGNSFGNYTMESDGTQNDSITFGWEGQAGTYSINVSHRKGSNRGQYTVYIDGVVQGGGSQLLDAYNSTPADTVSSIGTTFQVITDGPHTIQFVMATKNASSSSYVGSVSGIFLTRTGALT